MRTLLAGSAPVSLRPQGYLVRGVSKPVCFIRYRPKNACCCRGRHAAENPTQHVGSQRNSNNSATMSSRELHFDSANRFLLEPTQGERLFVLDDPLGGAHPDPEFGRTLERLANLISRLPPHRKIIVAQSQDVIYTALGRTQLQACAIAGHSWADLGKYPPEFSSRLWVEMATLADVPPSLKDRMADALSKAEVILEPGCLQHLALSRDALSEDMPLDQAICLAREPARSLGQALATDPPTATLSDSPRNRFNSKRRNCATRTGVCHGTHAAASLPRKDLNAISRVSARRLCHHESDPGLRQDTCDR